MGKGSGEQKLYGLVANRGSTMVETERKIFDFGRSRSMENSFLSVMFASVLQWKHDSY